MPSIGQTWDIESIGAVVEMGILSTLKRLLMESNMALDIPFFFLASKPVVPTNPAFLLDLMTLLRAANDKINSRKPYMVLT
jgi:hypothetical protein